VEPWALVSLFLAGQKLRLREGQECSQGNRAAEGLLEFDFKTFWIQSLLLSQEATLLGVLTQDQALAGKRHLEQGSV
jgi:hypothetical protein